MTMETIGFKSAAEQWLTMNCDPEDPENCCVSDINNSTIVAADDMAIVAEQWLRMGCPDRTPPCTFP